MHVHVYMYIFMYISIHTYMIYVVYICYYLLLYIPKKIKKTFWIAQLPSPYCPCQLLQSRTCKVSSSEPHIPMHFEVRKSGSHLLWAEDTPRLFGFKDLDPTWFSDHTVSNPKKWKHTVWHLSSCSKRRSMLEAQFQSPSEVVGFGSLCGSGFTSQGDNWKHNLPQEKTCHGTNTR